MSNKSDRDAKEMKNLFLDPKYCREAWRGVGHAILQNPAVRLPPCYDKEGNPTLASLVDDYSYSKLKRDIATLSGEDANREPTELEMILQCQIAKARWDTSAATFVRDTLGAKPVDEAKVDQTVVNDFAGMTDEELEMLAAFREKQAQAQTQTIVEKEGE
jgi:hypothetical protein